MVLEGANYICTTDPQGIEKKKKKKGGKEKEETVRKRHTSS